MPVKKFKTFDEAERDLWCMDPDEEYYKRVRKILDIGGKLYKSKLKPGLYKYKTIQEAQAHLEEMRKG
jgi:hypothetical protein